MCTFNESPNTVPLLSAVLGPFLILDEKVFVKELNVYCERFLQLSDRERKQGVTG